MWEENIFPPLEKAEWLPLLPLGLLFFISSPSLAVIIKGFYSLSERYETGSCSQFEHAEIREEDVRNSKRACRTRLGRK